MAKDDNVNEVEDVNNEEKVLDAPEATLNEVHDEANRQLNEEAPDENGDGEEDSEGAEAESGDGGSGAEDEDKGDEEAGSAPEVPEDKPTPELKPEVKEEKLEEVKLSDPVKVKSYDGKVYEFNSLDDVPEDFEPSSYKEFARFTREMIKKENTDAEILENNRTLVEEKEKQERVDAIKAGWDADIKSLDAELPKDPNERKELTDAVFNLMNEELSKGKVIDFAPAYEIYMYRESQKEKIENLNRIAEDKKRRGGMVVGNSPAGNGPKTKVIEAPPQGTSLDDVHASVLGSL